MNIEKKVLKWFLTAFVVLILGITVVAFATVSKDIKIKGNTSMDTAEWEVKFTNLGTASLVGDAEIISAPTITSTKISGLKVMFTQPGDSVKYTFDVVNSGTIDARIGDIVKKNFVCSSLMENVSDEHLVCEGINYKLTYTDTGVEVAVNDVIDAGKTKNVTLYLGFDATTSPKNDVNVSGLEIRLIFKQ